MPVLTRSGAFSATVGPPSIRAEDGPLEGSDLQIWIGDQIPAVCRSPVLLARLKNWKDLAGKGIPNLADMYTSEEEGALEDAMLLLQHGGDFIYVFQGGESVRKYGRTFRGATLSKIQGNLTVKMLNMYNTCVRDAVPTYSQFNADFSTQHVCWERLSVPLTAGSDGPKFVLTYSFPLDDKLEILTSVFERSPIGMIAAAAELGENKPLSAARITLINSRARDILKLRTSSAVVRTVQDLRQWIKDVAGWTQLTETQNETTKRQTIRYEEKATGRKYMIMIEPVSRFVVFHLLETEA